MTYEERKAMFEGMVKKMAMNYNACEGGAMTKQQLVDELISEVYLFVNYCILEGE